MTNCMHFMHPPKNMQIWWGRHNNFCVWKKSAITFGEGCTLMLDVHVYSEFMAWNLGYLAKKVHDIPPTLTKNNLFGLTWFFIYTLYACKRIHWLFFYFGNTLLGNFLPNLEPHPTRRHVINELLITSICDCDWLIDEIWFFYLPSAVIVKLQHYGKLILSRWLHRW